MAFKIFVDGQAGTTGLQIHQRLAMYNQIELLEISDADRKNIEVKRKVVNDADLIFLCLPDDAARETVSLIDNPHTKVIDSSTAHRTADGWVYGLPELKAGQRELIQQSKRVAVTGCHAAASILCLAPLTQSKILPVDSNVHIHSITGYSGGGKAMIAEYESPNMRQQLASPRPYALSLAHKHIPEIVQYTQLESKPVFVPIVANYYQGLAVTVPLHTNQLLNNATAEQVHKILSDYYANEPFINVLPFDVSAGTLDGFYDVQSCVGTNRVDISVYGNQDQILIMSRLDNLGKGASGAAIQCMNLMLGLKENSQLAVDTIGYF